MPVITASAHPAALWPGVAKWFGSSYDEFGEEWRDLFEYTTSDKRYEERVSSPGFGLAPEKPEGAPVTFVSDAQGYTSRITNRSFALGFQVTIEELEDNQYQVKAFDRAGKLAFSMRETKETVCSNVYNRAFSSSYPGGDGVSLISGSHPTLSGNQSNLLSPAADLSELAIEDLCIQIGKAKAPEGKRIKLMAQSLHIPVDLKFIAQRIYHSDKQSGTANNDTNAVKDMNVFPGGIKVNHYFTDTDAWFIRTRVPKATGMIYQERVKGKLVKDNEFTTQNAQAMSRDRYGVGWADWRGVYGSPGN